MNPTTSQTAVKSENLFLFTMAGIELAHMLDFMIIMSLGPQLIRFLHLDTHQFGLLVSSYTFAAAVSGLLSSTYVDRFDRRKLLLLVFAVFIAATFCCGLAFNFLTLLVARAFAGAFGGILGSMVHTVVADVIPFERRGRAVGIVMAAFSVSSVCGIPFGLFLANNIPALGWRAPFFFIVLISCVVFIVGYKVLPNLTSHIGRPKVGNIFEQIYAVAKHPNHLRAYAVSSLLVMSSFSIIPYFPIYLTSNVGLPENMLTLVYLCSGTATFFTARIIGRLTDHFGKLRVFRAITGVSCVVILIATHLKPLAWPLILVNSTIFFVLLMGRFIPGMAMITEVPEPHIRGTFMSLIASIRMFSSGMATLIGGFVVSRAANGQIEHFDVAGYIGAGCGIAAIWAAHQIRLKPTKPAAQAKMAEDQTTH